LSTYDVERNSKPYSVEVQLLESTDTYFHVTIGVDDGTPRLDVATHRQLHSEVPWARDQNSVPPPGMKGALSLQLKKILGGKMVAIGYRRCQKTQ